MFYTKVKMSHNSQPGFPDDMSAKQRFELERWARLNGMSVEDFVSANLKEQQRIFQALHAKSNSDSLAQNQKEA
ncbi:hypothetical protein [Cerasicoccus fimbriatus]|uniref:hypothetical protein n=1 Tax=Cerasicoccus fimbriatus TaxID=3014554 RepID=UPI0022B3411E|nr:hypothetical protein [Cerasicoccus sp. TK19100]